MTFVFVSESDRYYAVLLELVIINFRIMDQDFSKFYMEITEEPFPDFEADGPDDIYYLSPSKVSPKVFCSKQILESKNNRIRRLQTHLAALTKCSFGQEMNN